MWLPARLLILFNHYGIDEEGPVPDMQSDYAVLVPDTITTLTHNQELSLQEARDAAFQTGDHDGILAYQVVLQIDSFYLNCYSWFTVLTSYTWNELLIQLV